MGSIAGRAHAASAQKSRIIAAHLEGMWVFNALLLHGPRQVHARDSYRTGQASELNVRRIKVAEGVQRQRRIRSGPNRGGGGQASRRKNLHPERGPRFRDLAVHCQYQAWKLELGAYLQSFDPDPC